MNSGLLGSWFEYGEFASLEQPWTQYGKQNKLTPREWCVDFHVCHIARISQSYLNETVLSLGTVPEAIDLPVIFCKVIDDPFNSAEAARF